MTAVLLGLRPLAQAVIRYTTLGLRRKSKISAGGAAVGSSFTIKPAPPTESESAYFKTSIQYQPPSSAASPAASRFFKIRFAGLSSLEGSLKDAPVNSP